jgi:anti-sigma B factor antagonist
MVNPEVEVRLAGNVAIVDMTGRVTLGEGCNLLRETVKQLLNSDRKHILLNLKNVSYIDSSGLGQLAGCYVTTSRMGGQLKILNTEGKVHDLLQITKLFTVFVTFSDEAEAIASF